MSEAWKCGNEFAPYHPQASHVDPDYRDGWNACYRAALVAFEERRKPLLEALKRYESARIGEDELWQSVWAVIEAARIDALTQGAANEQR